MMARGDRTAWWAVPALLALGLAFGAQATADDVFAKKCASCHGKDGAGSEKMAKMLKLDAAGLDLTDGATQAKKDAALIAVVTDGEGKMPAFKGKLSKDEIAGAVAHVRSLAGGGAGSDDYAKKCASCHGKDGAGSEKMAKMLKVDMAALDMIDEATQEKEDDELAKIITDGEGKMPAYGKKLDADAIKAVVGYLRELAD